MSRFSFAPGRPIEGAVSQATPTARLAFLRKVYALFLLGLGIAGVGGYIGMNALDAIMANSMVLFIGYIATFIVCQWQRRAYPVNIALFGLFTFISGLLWAPILSAYLLAGESGILVQALGITCCIFAGLTVYTLTSKSDFSYLGGALSIGIFALIGLMIFGMFFPISSGMDFAISIGAVVLFSGFILYDTSNILHHYRTDEYVAGALALYLDFILLLRYVLALLSRRD